MTGMNTPRSSVVITTVTIAARLGDALRRSARKASAMKKKIRPTSAPRRARRGLAVGVALADTHLGAHAERELARRLLVVRCGHLIAHQPALVEGEHPAAHLVDH